jgi:hypothetical protein
MLAPISVLQRVGPLLRDDREMGEYTRDASRQRGVSTWSMQRSYLEDNWGDPVSSLQESVRKRFEPEAEE